MKHIESMDHIRFSEYILTKKIGDTIEFATDNSDVLDGNEQDINLYGSWYFARLMKIDGYDSHFILIDYCGGEEAYAIPLNNYSDFPDEDDKEIIPVYIKNFFKNCINLNGEESFIYVLMEEINHG